MKITLYHTTEWVNNPWLAHMELAPQLFMPFFGKTAEEARNRAETWYAAEKDRWARIDTSEAEKPAVINPSPINKPSGRGAHFTGKVWLLNHATREKIRVEASEVDRYLASGFVKGGPRSQFTT